MVVRRDEGRVDVDGVRDLAAEAVTLENHLGRSLFRSVERQVSEWFKSGGETVKIQWVIFGTVEVVNGKEIISPKLEEETGCSRAFM